MKFLIMSLFLSFSALAFETQDHVLKLEKQNGKYLVGLATLSQVYSVPANSETFPCLELSLQKQLRVKLKLDIKKAVIQSCQKL